MTSGRLKEFGLIVYYSEGLRNKGIILAESYEKVKNTFVKPKIDPFINEKNIKDFSRLKVLEVVILTKRN